MKAHIPIRPLRIALLLMLCCGCKKEAPVTVIPPTPEPPAEPVLPVDPPEPARVRSTDFSLSNGITDTRDSLFIHFDRPITSSTIPHYDWITYYDYYNPQNRSILNDTTLVLVFDGHQADRFAEENAYSFKVTSADGIESEVSVSIPVYHHHVLVSGYLRQLSFYNDYKEVLFVQGKRIVRLDYITGETVREYDLSELPGNYLSYVKNRSNGMLYLVCSDSYDTIPDIYLLDPDTGELRVAGTVPEDPFDSYYQYRQPIALSFTKYGTGLVVLRSNQTSGHRLQVVHVADDGSLSFSSPFMDAEVWDAYSMYSIENLSLDMDGSSIYGFSYMGSAYYFIFDGETCRFRLGFSTPDHKQNAVAHKKDGSWLMRETHHQYVLYADGTTSPSWELDGRHRGGADFCYTPGYEHLVLFLEGDSFINDPARIHFVDKRTGEIVLSKLIRPGMSGFQTTPDGKYAVQYRSAGYGSRYDSEDTLILVYDLPFLLARCRL